MADKTKTNLPDYAARLMEQEAEALVSVSRCLDHSFTAAVNAIAGLPQNSRLVLMGIGKTSFVAMKISASFASLGVPSYFLHPTEALHGDLGRVTQDDLALLLSNSGETPEMVRIVPSLKKIGCKIISITSDHDSLIARKSDINIVTGRLPEIGTLGLAPTASTTAMLALGDALVMSVLEMRPVTKEQFALWHPGGTLGRTLMPVSEVMRSEDSHCVVHESIKVREVLQRITLTKGRPGAASVIDDSGKLAGVFTDGDLRRLLEKDGAFLEHPVSTVMTRTPKTVSADMLADQALKLMSLHKIDQVIVIDDGRRPVGMLDIQDLVEVY